MTLQDIASRGGSMGLRVVGEQVVGVYHRFPLRMWTKKRGAHDVIYTAFVPSKTVPNKVQKSIRQSLPKGVTFSVDTSASSITLIASGSIEADAFELTCTALDVALPMLLNASKPITPPETCAVCKKPACDSAAMVGVHFAPVHQECVVNQNEKTVAVAAKNASGGNVATGLLGAFLGAVVGCIPNIICILVLEMELGLLYMLIPLASYKGYELFRGKLGGLARMIVILCSVAGFVVSQFILFHLALIGEGMTVSFGESVNYYLYYMTFNDIIQSAWFGFLFLLIGIGSSWKQLGASNADRMKNAAINVESLTNLDGSVQPVYTAAVGTTAFSHDYSSQDRKSDSDDRPPMELDV